jgi:hypothetical protein
MRPIEVTRTVTWGFCATLNFSLPIAYLQTTQSSLTTYNFKECAIYSQLLPALAEKMGGFTVDHGFFFQMDSLTATASVRSIAISRSHFSPQLPQSVEVPPTQINLSF